MTLKLDALYQLLADAGFDPDYMEEETEIVICCPQCGDDRQRLYVSPDSGVWICFRCGVQGGLLVLLQEVIGLDFQEAMDSYRKLSEGRQGDDPFEDFVPQPDKPEPKAFTGVELPSSFHRVEDGRIPLHFVKYLERRHVSLDLAASRGLCYCLTGLYRYRIIVPVQTDGQLFTWVARTIFRRCPSCDGLLDDCVCDFKIRKVLTPTGGRPRLTLYNLDAVRGGVGRVVVVEGVFDALRLPTEAVALLGSAISPTQTALLAGIARGREVIVCLDGDDAGRQGARKVADALTSSMVRCRVARLPEGTDPNNLSKEELEDALGKARPYVL